MKDDLQYFDLPIPYTAKKSMLASIWIGIIAIACLGGGLAIGYYAIEPRIVTETVTETETITEIEYVDQWHNETIYVNTLSHLNLTTEINNITIRGLEKPIYNATTLNNSINHYEKIINPEDLWFEPILINNLENIFLRNINIQAYGFAPSYNISIWNRGWSFYDKEVLYTTISNSLNLTLNLQLIPYETLHQCYYVSIKPIDGNLTLNTWDGTYEKTSRFFDNETESESGDHMEITYQYETPDLYNVLFENNGGCFAFQYTLDSQNISNGTYQTEYISIINNDVIEYVTNGTGSPVPMNYNETQTIYSMSNLTAFSNMFAMIYVGDNAYFDDLILFDRNTNDTDYINRMFGLPTNSSIALNLDNEYHIRLSSIDIYFNSTIDDFGNNYYPTIYSLYINNVLYHIETKFYY